VTAGHSEQKGFMKVRIKQVDAFTDTPLSGNSAGVVLDADGLTPDQMQRIAREMAVAETAFVVSPSVSSADLRIRWFTPAIEVPLCGHATVAAFHALAEESMHGMAGEGSFRFSVETASGVLPVTVEKGPGGISIRFGLPVPEFLRAGQHKLDVMRILNISLEEFENRLPIVMEKYLYVPVRRLHTLFDLKPNFFAMSQFLTNRKLLGLCVFTTETVDRSSAVHSRFFAPSAGIEEDPVTGSANGPLGVYLFERGLVGADSETVAIVGEQGDAIGRKGRVLIELKVQGDRVLSVQIGGRAVTVLEGELLVA
jgi:PhzF family phenazine biosynthesis protein